MDFTVVEKRGVCFPRGFRAAGAVAGLKASGKDDVALIVSDVPAVCAGTFTTSLFPAAPVVRDRVLLESGGGFRAVFANSGNANACTGDAGERDAEATARMVAERLGVASDEVLVASTGRIGTPLPMDKIERGVVLTAGALSEDGGASAARAIMTTDTCSKEFAVSFEVPGPDGPVEVRVGGMAKGAGMIEPRMASVPHATMLAFITTDAAVERGFLSKVVSDSVERSFNRITVDGDESTNDTVLVLANGLAGGVPLSEGAPGAAVFASALSAAMEELARAIVLDGEGATKFVTVRVEGAVSSDAAEACARAIANSLLCKTAWFGNDPNWGRVLAAAGRSGASFDSKAVSLFYDDAPVVSKGMDAGTPEAELSKIMGKGEFEVRLELGAGTCSAEVWTCDISREYVTINADYHT